MLKALVVDAKDNVATALNDLEKSESVTVEIDGSAAEIQLGQPIPFGHKFALKDIGIGAQVIKYGEVIGLATAGIAIGEHVHVHNVEGLRGRGDRQ